METFGGIFAEVRRGETLIEPIVYGDFLMHFSHVESSSWENLYKPFYKNP